MKASMSHTKRFAKLFAECEGNREQPRQGGEKLRRARMPAIKFSFVIRCTIPWPISEEWRRPGRVFIFEGLKT
jgi:hypothetical protein